jgi:hypothetical protein
VAKGAYGESLNTTDCSGNGVQVNGRYWVEIIDRIKGRSHARRQHININHPVQYFFAMDYVEQGKAAIH